MPTRKQKDSMREPLLTSRNLKAASLALLLFVYLILVLSIASVPYVETIQRITVQRSFDESVFDSSMADSLASLGFFLLFFGVGIRSAGVRAASVLLFGVGIWTYVAGFEQLLLIAGLATVPLLGGLLLFSMAVTRS
ncbi:MAG: hypothetical protein ACRD5H_09710, partial [Nitrososphaerales archaeon]